ncbi:MAG: ROK family protein [Anaerolineaceae bacterium]|nr:ROK family protein [Anaerolineaceae bacterium]
MQTLGIDIGGSGIKGAVVDTETGEIVEERFRIPTPQPSLPEDVAIVLKEIVNHFDWHGPVGVTFPAIIKNGVAYSAANVDPSWIGTDAAMLFQRHTGCPGCPMLVINDADAAGIAEMTFGAGRGRSGVVIILTLGTGIGSAIFVNGHLLPNSELGHLEIRGKDAEDRASDRIRQEKDLSWKKWAERVDEALRKIEFLFSPDLFIIGGGVSKKHERFLPLLNTQAPVIPAEFLNDAGIVGAALAASWMANPHE